MFLDPAVDLRARPADGPAPSAGGGAPGRRHAADDRLVILGDRDGCQWRPAPDADHGLPRQRGLLLLAAASPSRGLPPSAPAAPASRSPGAAPDSSGDGCPRHDDSQCPSHLTPELPSSTAAVDLGARRGLRLGSLGRRRHRLHIERGPDYRCLCGRAAFAPAVQPGGPAISPQGQLPALRARSRRGRVQSALDRGHPWAAPGRRPSARAASAAAAADICPHRRRR